MIKEEVAKLIEENRAKFVGNVDSLFSSNHAMLRLAHQAVAPKEGVKPPNELLMLGAASQEVDTRLQDVFHWYDDVLVFLAKILLENVSDENKEADNVIEMPNGENNEQ